MTIEKLTVTAISGNNTTLADEAGKTIVLFATSGSTGFGKTVEGLLPSAPGATFHEGEVFHGKPANKGVHVKWLREVLK